MLDNSVVQARYLSAIEASAGIPINATGPFAPPFAPSTLQRRTISGSSNIPDELPVSVQVSGTTFLGVYGIVGNTVELMSPDFGEAVTALGAEIAQAVAERLLRTIADQEMQTSPIPFMQDHRSGPGF